jgi:monothiol glutaredoxin
MSAMLGAMAERIHRENSRNDVVLYMKGTAAFPQCSSSAAIVQILSSLGVAFKDMNVQEDGDLRQALKEYANWPNLPQLYIKGEFIGGVDIVREIYKTGELEELLKEKGVNYGAAA